MGPREALTVLVMNKKIGSSPLRVLLFVWAELDLSEFQPIKQEWLAKSLRMQQAYVSRILRMFVAEGVLETGPMDGPAKTYRNHPELRTVAKMLHDEQRQ